MRRILSVFQSRTPCARRILAAPAPTLSGKTRRPPTLQPLRRSALVYNHLCGEVFEDKAKLALLLQKSSLYENSLRSFTFKTPAKFARWCRVTSAGWGERLWVAKIPLGNSGSGVWMLGPRNWKAVVDAVISSVAESDRAGNGMGRDGGKYAVVVQEYMARPMLWRSRKLQFRVYAVITGDLSCWIYRHGMLQFCNKPYKLRASLEGDYDDEMHITNVCRNVSNEAFHKGKTLRSGHSLPFCLPQHEGLSR